MNMSRGKTAILIIALAGSSYYGISKYRSLTPSPAINNGVSGEFERVRRSGGERRDNNDEGRRQQFAKMAQLTPDQEAQMKKIRESGVEGRDRWTSMAAVLTPEQRQRMDAARQERRDRGAKAALSGADFEKYRQKRDQMRAQRGPRGPRTGGRGGQSR